MRASLSRVGAARTQEALGEHGEWDVLVLGPDGDGDHVEEACARATAVGGVQVLGQEHTEAVGHLVVAPPSPGDESVNGWFSRIRLTVLCESGGQKGEWASEGRANLLQRCEVRDAACQHDGQARQDARHVVLATSIHSSTRTSAWTAT